MLLSSPFLSFFVFNKEKTNPVDSDYILNSFNLFLGSSGVRNVMTPSLVGVTKSILSGITGDYIRMSEATFTYEEQQKKK
jgi:hypothetical protein